MRKKLPGIFLVSLFVLFLTGYLFRTQIYRLSPAYELSEEQRLILIREASRSLATSDVPVGALLLYGDSILSLGHNTVQGDTNIAGHAEINAVNNALAKIGFDQFASLDRDKLMLVSTFEPCMMCAHAIMEYRIEHVYFMKPKSAWHWLKQQAREIRYELNKYHTTKGSDQDSLFRLHPDYKE